MTGEDLADLWAKSRGSRLERGIAEQPKARRPFIALGSGLGNITVMEKGFAEWLGPWPVFDCQTLISISIAHKINKITPLL